MTGLAELNHGNRSAPLVMTQLESRLQVDQVDLTPAFLPDSHTLHDLMFRHDNGHPMPFAVNPLLPLPPLQLVSPHL